jgi:hypothetical protein
MMTILHGRDQMWSFAIATDYLQILQFQRFLRRMIGILNNALIESVVSFRIPGTGTLYVVAKNGYSHNSVG